MSKPAVSVVAAERGEELLVEFGPEFAFLADDAVYLCGSGSATARFYRMFPQS